MDAWDSIFDRILRLLMPWRLLDGYMLCQADSSGMDGSTQTAELQRRNRGYVSQNAIGQLANHPPPGRKPNTAFFWVRAPLDDASFSTLPVTYFWWRPRFGRQHVMTLLVSTSIIEDGEEVLVDYGFPEDSAAAGKIERPDWYAACSPTSEAVAR
ncbi:unnamed protein product [Polarella glacialis]|nr:unnamed protein product [Polarella glacialis]CAE8670652.1 unnamed protein product [Polarella glacialis]